MKNKVRFLSIALALLMVMPMLAAFGVSAEEPAAKNYADAKDGELLFTADFNATTGAWTPSQANAKSWDSMTVVPSADGSSATLTPTKDHSKNRAAIGAQLSNYKGPGNSYTVTFTVSSDDPGQCVAFYADWGTGFVLFPNEKKVSVGQYGSWKKSGDYVSYSAGGTGAQTYAIEFAVTNTKRGVNQDTTKDLYAVSTYKIYVKDGTKWVLVMEMDETQRNLTEWSDTDPEMTLRFVRYYNKINDVNQTSGVTVSNVNVYKGINLTTNTNWIFSTALLYEANFNGTEGIWNPQPGSNSWNAMTAVPSADGKSVALTPTKDNGSGTDKGRANWGGTLPNDAFPVANSSYTVVYTVETDTAGAEVGLYLDCGTGFIVSPGLNRFSVGQYGNQTKIHGTGYYLGSAALTQTYAVEVECTGGTAYPDDDIKCTAYKLYVKNGDAWTLVYSLSETEMEKMLWTINPEDITNQLYLRFFRSPGDGFGDKAVTVKDLSVYKGLVVASTIQEKQPLTGGTIDVTSKEDGELLYKVNFNGDDNFTPGALIKGIPVLNTSVDESGKLTLSVPTAEDKLFHYWGGEIKGLPLDELSQYTVFVTVERSKATSATDPVLGISVDGLYYAVGNSSEIQLTTCGNGRVRSLVDYQEGVVAGDHGSDYDTTTEPFTQTYAIEIDGPNMSSRAIRVYLLTNEGTYQLVTNSDDGSNVQFMNDNLSLYFFQSNADQPVVINSAEIYKDRTIEALNAAVKAEQDAQKKEETNTDNNPADSSDDKTNTPDNKTEEPIEKGCKSTIASFWIVMAMIMVVSVLFIKKKNYLEKC